MDPARSVKKKPFGSEKIHKVFLLTFGFGLLYTITKYFRRMVLFELKQQVIGT